jgi:hypothetical protein
VVCRVRNQRVPVHVTRASCSSLASFLRHGMCHVVKLTPSKTCCGGMGESRGVAACRPALDVTARVLSCFDSIAFLKVIFGSTSGSAVLSCFDSIAFLKVIFGSTSGSAARCRCNLHFPFPWSQPGDCEQDLRHLPALLRASANSARHFSFSLVLESAATLQTPQFEFMCPLKRWRMPNFHVTQI